MALRSRKTRKVRLVFGRSHPLLKTAVAALITAATVTIVTLSLGYRQTKQQIELLRQQAVELERENARLEENIQSLGTVESIKRIAAEELGLVDPDTIIIDAE